MKADPNLKELGSNVQRIRRAQNGELLLELKMNSTINGASCKQLIQSSLGDSAQVRALSQQTTIECRDLDEITTAEEVCAALQEQLQLESLSVSSIKQMRKAYGDTQIAIIRLPADQARRLILVGKIKIGWTVCRLRELTMPVKCFRCLEYGHIAKVCKNDDRSKQCRRCGVEGHLAKACNSKPRCYVCKSDDGSPAEHVAGSSRCRLYKEARSIRK